MCVRMAGNVLWICSNYCQWKRHFFSSSALFLRVVHLILGGDVIGVPPCDVLFTGFQHNSIEESEILLVFFGVYFF